MPTLPAVLPPFQLRLPTVPAATPGGTDSAAGQAAAPRLADLVDVRTPLPDGGFTAEAGDRFSLRELFDAGPGSFDAVAQWRVALRDPAGGARLILRGNDVTARTEFTAAEYNELLFEAGPRGSATDLLVVARAGRPDGSGGLTAISDSRPAQLTASVTGTRSLEAAAALRSAPDANEAAYLDVAADAALFDGLGKTRPAVTTAGHFGAAAGDRFSVRELFDAGPGAFDRIARYRVALRDEGASGARLELRGVDVTARTDFTTAEFTELQFVAGAAGTRQDLVVVARQARESGGQLSGIVDSLPVGITATVDGVRTANAAAALRTPPDPADAGYLRVASESALFDGFGAERPKLASVGDVTVAGGDLVSVRELFDAGPGAFDRVAEYRVGLRGEGRLTLRGADVSGRASFTPSEFLELGFQAGASGTAGELIVAARTGRANGSGGLTGIVDSLPRSVGIAAMDQRSLNVAAALRTPATGDDAAFLRVAADSALFDGLGAQRPTLTTVGNLTTAAGDALSLRELFDAGPGAFDALAAYRVALRGEGRLTLRGADVTTRTDFTPAEFNELLFVAGAANAAGELAVVARRGTPNASGGLSGIVDSPAVAITATATGMRSVNAAAALRTPVQGADAAFLRLASDAGLFNGLGAPRPALTTVGDFTAVGGERYGLRDLFDAGPRSFDTVARWRVALRGDGALTLRGADVTARTDFTPAEFNELGFVAGPSRGGSELLVVARTGVLDGSGGLTRIVDSAAVAITASGGSATSINAAAALRPAPGTPEPAYLRLIRDAALFSDTGRAAPTLRVMAAPPRPQRPGSEQVSTGLDRAIGAFRSTAMADTTLDAATLWSDAVGGSISTGVALAAETRAALLTLGALGLGGSRRAGGTGAGRLVAINA